MHSRLTESPPQPPNHQRWLARHLALVPEYQDKTGTTWYLAIPKWPQSEWHGHYTWLRLGGPQSPFTLANVKRYRKKRAATHPAVAITDAFLKLPQLSSIVSILLQIKMTHFCLRQRGAAPKHTSPGKRACVPIRQTDLRLRTINSGMPGVWGV